MAMSDVDTMLEQGRDVWAVACNYREATKVARKGALALVVAGSGAGMGYERVEVIVRPRSGRLELVRQWVDIRRLDNFRTKCIPVGHRARDLRYRWAGLFFSGKMAAEEHADALATLARRDRTERPRRDEA